MPGDPITASAALLYKIFSDVISAFGKNRKDYFVDHIEPAHNRMLVIHEDYVDGFTRARQILRDRSAPNSTVWEFLYERRRDRECERNLSVRLAEELASARRKGFSGELWQSVEDYCDAIMRYYHSGTRPTSMSWYSDYLQEAEDTYREFGVPNYHPVMISGRPLATLLKSIENLLDHDLPRSINLVNSNYARLRSRLL